MQINLENLSGLERKLSITIPAEQVEDRVKTKLNKIAAEVKISGFRPGKVPFDIVQQRYAGIARSEVLEDLIRKTYSEAIEKNSLEPAGLPNIKLVSSQPGEQFAYDAIFEVYPEVKINDFKQLEVEKIVAQVTADDVNDTLERMRKSQAKWQEIADVGRKSQLGDRLTVDFTIKPCEPDKEIEAKTETDVKFVLGDGSMWNDFEQPLYGVSSGEEKSYNLQLPAEHMDKKLAGNRVNFTVKIHKVCEPILPELNDEFAASMRIKEGGIERLRVEIRNHMDSDLQSLLRRLFKDTMMDKLLESNPIEIPKVLVADELKLFAQQWEQRFSSAKTGSIKKTPVFPQNDFVEKAKRTVALRLLLSDMIKEHKFMVEPLEVRKKIEELISGYYQGSDNKDKMVNKYFSDQQRVAEIEAMLLEEKVSAYLESKINITEKAISYKEAMEQRK